MSIKQAAIVERYVWEEQHSCMSDYFAVIDDVAEMISRVITAK